MTDRISRGETPQDAIPNSVTIPPGASDVRGNTTGSSADATRNRVLTLRFWINAVDCWVWAAFADDGTAPGSAKGAAGGFPTLQAAHADAAEWMPSIVEMIE